MSTALLVIDVPHALCVGDYVVFEADRVIESVNAVLRRAREAGAMVMIVQHEEPDGPLTHGTAGWQLAAGLRVEAGDVHLRKTATESFHDTDLRARLAARGVTKLLICGLRANSACTRPPAGRSRSVTRSCSCRTPARP